MWQVAYDMLVEPDDDDDESDGKDDTACLSEFVEQAKVSPKKTASGVRMNVNGRDPNRRV